MIIKTIGIMTGNSLDAADAVLSVFDDDGGVCDLAAFSLPYPPALRERFLRLKENIKYYVSMAETAADPLFAATVEPIPVWLRKRSTACWKQAVPTKGKLRRSVFTGRPVTIFRLRRPAAGNLIRCRWAIRGCWPI